MDQGGSGGGTTGGSGPSFDMSKMSTPAKILIGGGALLFIDSFLSWQKACASFQGVGGFCVSFNAWSGNGSFFGVIMAIGAIALVAWEVAQMMGMSMSTGGLAPSKLSAYLGFGTAAFGIVKFLLAVTNHGAIFAWIGLVLILVVAYGAWMRFQEPAASGGGSMMSPGGDTTPPMS